MSKDHTSGGLPRQANPCCGWQSDSAQSLKGLIKDEPGTPPKKDDLSVCIGCGSILVYVDPAKNIQRVATPEDLVRLPAITLHELSELKHAVQQMHKTTKWKQRHEKN
jgi:hypothetical protein